MKSEASRSRRVRRKKQKWIFFTVLFVACAVVFFDIGWRVRSHYVPSPGSLLAKGSLSDSSRLAGMTTNLQHETVDVIGGSMAHGWLDPHDDSYLRRALTARTQSTNVSYKYIDHTSAGNTPYMIQQKGKFQDWLKKDHPQVVLLSWGILNSMSSRHRISQQKFETSVRQEMQEALKAHAVVLIVTPPVTKESAINDHAKQEVWINQMFQEAASLKSKNIYTIDVYHQMEAYMKAHDKTYKNYYGNSWHPNQAGHILAGQILANDLVQIFGMGPIQWKG